MSESTRLKKLTAALSRPQHTLSPDAEDVEWAYWKGKLDVYVRLSPIHSALKAVVEFLSVSGTTHTCPEQESNAFFEGYEQAMKDIQEWAKPALAALDSELAKLADKADQFDGSERSSNGLEGRG